MKEKTRKIFIMIVMAALIVSLMAASFAALTYGRYSGGRFDENSPYGDYIDFVGATAFEVSTADELVNAINNGYSYIKISDDAEKPFVVNNNVADVYTNLVLDVNGHVVVRNSRNPLLDVQKSVSVVLVYDSSEKAGGGFYNPVGSALQTSGGTLTVGAGVYESGPNEEYQTESYQTGQQVVTLFKRGEDRKRSYPETGTLASDLPILTGKNAGTQEDPVFVYDFYFESAPGGNVNSLIEDDTYLIYTEEKNAFVEQGEETVGGTVLQNGQLYVNAKKDVNGTVTSAEAFSPICNVASCDFYYYYPVGAAGTANSPQTYAVVYGYNDVKSLASNEKGAAETLQGSGLVWPYAAIRSEAGNTHARGGAFKTHFGVENTYCIYSAGGTMTVGGTAEPTFSAVQSGVCIRMMEGGETEEQRSAPSLTIDSGVFSSEIGDTIKMSGGEMDVKKGTFKKNAKDADEDSTNNGSAISISGGTLTSSDTQDTSKPIQFNISGSYVNGIYAKGGEVNIANATFAFENGKNNQGVYNDGGTSRARWCEFSIPGDNNYGIHSTNGTTRASDCAITMKGEYAVGVYTTGGRALVEGGKIEVAFAENKSDGLLTSAAVSTEGGEIYLAGSLKIESDSLGVTVRKVDDTEGSLEIADQEIKIENTTYKVAKGNVSIKTPNATGIYINNGSLTNKGTVTVTSCVGEDGTDNDWSWVDENGNAIQYFNKYNGVYVQGGSLVSNGTLNVTFTGVENDAYGSGANSNLNANTAYRDFQIKSYAVRVEGTTGTTVTIVSGNILNGSYDENGNVKENSGVGGGVYVGGGTVTLGVKNGNTGPTVQTTGTDMYEEELNPHEAGSNWVYQLTKKGGPAVKVAGGESTTIYGGSYTAKQGDGIVTVGGIANIYNGTFEGNDNYKGAGQIAGVGASYSFKVYGGMANVYGGTFGISTGTASGAFVMGTSTEDGTANIYGGSFEVSSHNTGGQAAFSVFQYAKVLVDPGKGGEQQNLGGDVTMTGLATGFAVEQHYDQGATSSVTICGGNFSSTRKVGGDDGFWYGNASVSLEIKGGTFTGSYRSGIKIDVPAPDKVKIMGGTFVAGQTGLPISDYFNQVVPSGYGIIDGSNTQNSRCTIGPVGG